MRVRVGSRSLDVSKHALERYQLRVAPAFEGAALAEQLERVIVHGEVTGVRPAWLPESRWLTDEYVMLGDWIVFPIRHGMLVTCYTPGVGEQARAVRNERARADRVSRQEKGRHFGAVQRRERRRRRDAKGAVE